MKKESGLINFFPIVDSKLTWKNVEIDLGKNLSKIKIKQDGKEIYVDGSLFFDLNKILSELALKKDNIEYQSSGEFDVRKKSLYDDSVESNDSNL